MSLISDKDARYMDQIYNLQEHVAELEGRIYNLQEHVAELEDRIDTLGAQAKHYKEKSIHWEETCHAQAETSHKAESDCNTLLKRNIALKARLSPTAGVSTLSINNLVDSHKFTVGNTAGQTRMIQELIAKSAPKIEGEL